MPATYESIATTLLSSASSSITFSSIPATYTDLRLVVVGLNSSGVQMSMRFNSDSTSNYSETYLYATAGGSAATGRQANLSNGINLTQLVNIGQAGFPVFLTADIFSYAGSTNKTVLSANNGDLNGDGNGGVLQMIGLWRSTSAINTITLTTTSAATYAIGTSATLYGIKAA